MIIKFEERLYDYELVEWNKVLNFIESEKNIIKISKKKIRLDKFHSIRGAEPIEIYQVWKYSKEKVEFNIVCLQYGYVERERLGDGQMGHSSRVTNFRFTSFWFVSKNYFFEIQKIIIEPATVVEKLHQLIKKNQFYGILRFNLRYIVETNNLEKVNSVLTKYIQELFTTYYKIWCELSEGTILVRDDKPMSLESFRKKFYFTKELIRKITENNER